jgi:phage/conjugal plasmid C-4 type zinc finger TraR family protein
MVARSSLAFGIGSPFIRKEFADKDLEMASGWAPDGAVQDQIDDTVADAVKIARAKMPVGESLFHCTECGEPIAEGRRCAVPGVRTCIECQSARDARPVASGINRRGSKDSQLR